MYFCYTLFNIWIWSALANYLQQQKRAEASALEKYTLMIILQTMVMNNGNEITNDQWECLNRDKYRCYKNILFEHFK